MELEGAQGQAWDVQLETGEKEIKDIIWHWAIAVSFLYIVCISVPREHVTVTACVDVF